MLKAIADDAILKDSLADIRLAAACLLAFAGFLRYNEVSNIRPCEIQFNVNHIFIKICRSKGDQDDEVVIAKTNSSSCPVAMLDHYMAKAKIPVDSNVLPNSCRKDPQTTRLWSTVLSELLKEKLYKLGFSSVEISPHSLRAGGQQQLLKLEFLIDSFNAMGGGGPKKLRMDTWLPGRQQKKV